MDIAQHIQELQASLPQGVTLVAVSKFHPVKALQEAYPVSYTHLTLPTKA